MLFFNFFIFWHIIKHTKGVDKMVKGAVFFDYDGTLVDQTEKIFIPTVKTIEAVKRLKANGYMVGIATGRSRCYIPHMDIDFNCCISTNGTCVQIDKKEIFKINFNNEYIKSAIEYFNKNGFVYVVEEQEKCFTSSFQDPLFKTMIDHFKINTDKFELFDGNVDGLEINKLMLMYKTKEDCMDFINKFGDKFDVTSHKSFYSSDVNLKGITKADGINAVIKYMNLCRENTYAFGDGENDYEMLEAVGTGIAMGVHAEKLNKLNNLYITDTVKEDGIFNALKHFDLI